VATAKLKVQPFKVDISLTTQTYRALKQAITSMNIYSTDEEIRLDEHQLAEDLGVSRTPIREAMCRLEQEGLVRTVARKGAFVVRKTKAEILEMITVWAAIESMAARLVAERRDDSGISTLRRFVRDFDDAEVNANIDEYSDKNVEFHQQILMLSRCELFSELTENIFIHISSIRANTIGQSDRFSKSIVDHLQIIEALEAHDADLAERLVREHTLNLGTHVEKNVDFLS
jgi:DNA-binding GntR family transcriptional regulator